MKHLFLILVIALALMMSSCADVEENKPVTEDGPEENVEVLPTPDEPITEPKDDVPYIDENGEEAVNPEQKPNDTPSELPEFFFPDKPDDYDGLDAEFIMSSIAAMGISEVKAVWGDGDMNQNNGVTATVAYFAEGRDIVIYYNPETEEITEVETIENIHEYEKNV